MWLEKCQMRWETLSLSLYTLPALSYQLIWLAICLWPLDQHNNYSTIMTASKIPCHNRLTNEVNSSWCENTSSHHDGLTGWWVLAMWTRSTHYKETRFFRTQKGQCSNTIKWLAHMSLNLQLVCHLRSVLFFNKWLLKLCHGFCSLTLTLAVIFLIMGNV